MKKLLSLFTLLYSCISCINVQAADIFADSCSKEDVQAAVDSAIDGDKVVVPEGTCTWNEPVAVGRQISWNPPRYEGITELTIEGAGIGKTVISDESPKNDKGIFAVITEEGKSFRLTGFTFQGGNTVYGSDGVIGITGTTRSWRIDHCQFSLPKSRPIVIRGFTYGVIDHCDFNLNQTGGIYVDHSLWGGHAYGDGSWADELSLGTGKAIYMEDNTFFTQDWVDGFVDSCGGARWVFRRNQVKNKGLGNHGTDSTNRTRGTFSYEIYANSFDRSLATSWWTVFHTRSGTGVMFDNVITGRFNSLGIGSVYRTWHAFPAFGGCDGTSPYDLNDERIHDSGSHTGGNGEAVLEAAGKTWTPDQWVGYSLYNKNQSKSGMITANTATAITVFPDPYDEDLIWNSGDDFEILRAYPCLDQVGRSTGNLISGDTPAPEEWPQQVREPFYEWNNTINGTDGDFTGRPPLVEGRDYYNDAKRPDYSPYIHPHPLTVAPFGSTICQEGKIVGECWCEGMKTGGHCYNGKYFPQWPMPPSRLRTQ